MTADLNLEEVRAQIRTWRQREEELEVSEAVARQQAVRDERQARQRRSASEEFAALRPAVDRLLARAPGPAPRDREIRLLARMFLSGRGFVAPDLERLLGADEWFHAASEVLQQIWQAEHRVVIHSDELYDLEGRLWRRIRARAAEIANEVGS